MEQQLPQKSRFWRLPIYFGRIALFLAIVPIAMTVLCIVTNNSFAAFIDLYYCFVTPIQICKWSVVFALIFAAITRFAIGQIYLSGSDSCIYREAYATANKYYCRATLITFFELAFFFFVVLQIA